MELQKYNYFQIKILRKGFGRTLLRLEEIKIIKKKKLLQFV